MTDRKKCSRSDCHHPYMGLNGTLPLSEFGRSKYTKDKRKSQCKYCSAINKQSYDQFLKRTEQVAQGVKNCGNASCPRPNPQPLNNFNIMKAAKCGYSSYCKRCRSEQYHATKELKRPIPLPGKKLCSKTDCQNPKADKSGLLPLSEFYKHSKSKDGLKYSCRHCGKRWGASKERKEANRKYSQSEKGKASGERYLRTDAGKQTAIRSQAARRTRKTKAGGSFSKEEWMSLCAKYDYKCVACHKAKPLEADHINPVALGGTSNIDNIQPLCGSCNRSKGVKVVDYRF